MNRKSLWLWRAAAPTRRLPIALLAATANLLVGCGGGDSTPTVSGNYVGRVAGSNAFVAIITDGTAVRAYVCDGKPDGTLTIAEWFKGNKTGDSVVLDSLNGTARLAANFTPDRVTGTVDVPILDPLNFQATPVSGDAGFYLYKSIHNSTLYWASWIVLPTGEQVGSLSTPLRTSLDVTLSTSTRTAQIPQVGTVQPVLGTVSTVNLQFQGCTGFQCP